MEKKKMPGTELVQSVERALDILEIVTDAENGLRLNEIASKINLKNTTVHNLIRTLAAKGFLEKDENNVYTAGERFLSVAERSANRKFQARLESVITELATELGNATVIISEMSGYDVKVKLRMSPEQSGIIQRPEHFSMCPYSSVSGLLFLAFSDNRDAIMKNYPFVEYGNHIWKTEEKLFKHLEEIKGKGFSSEWNTAKEGFRIAVPFKNYGIGIDIKAGKVSKERQTEILKILGKTIAKINSKGVSK